MRIWNIFRKKVKEDRLLKWTAVGALLTTVVINAYANVAKLGGANTGEVSAAYPNLFTPTGLTFSIWGVIYALLFAYGIYQFAAVRKKTRSRLDERLFATVASVFIISCFANIGWMFAWHGRIIWLSMVCMLVLLASLVIIAQRLQQAFTTTATTRHDYLWLKLPFMVYLGWISVATIANGFALAVSVGWNGTAAGAGSWLACGLIGGAVVGLGAMWRLRDAAYGAVLVWAYGGILIKHLSETGHNGAYPSAIALLGVIIPVLASAVLYLLTRQCQAGTSGRKS